jgi:hypothetical protein
MVKSVYSKTSPYYSTTQTRYYLDLWAAPNLQPSALDAMLLVSNKYVHRPDLLSQDLYGTPRLWWVFSMLNPDQIKDPIYDLISGIEIKIPSKASLQGFL